MAFSVIPKQRTVDGLREVWASIERLAAELTDDQWKLATPVPEWDVQANVVHILGTEAMLLGLEPEVTVDGASFAHVHNAIGAANENWIASFVDESPSEVLAAFADYTSQRLDVLEAMSDDDWNAETFTPVGKNSYGRFMQIRVMDGWSHEQDIRVAVGRAGSMSGLGIEIALDEISTAMGFVVGKLAGAPSGASVTFDLTGPAARQIHISVGERAAVVPQLDGPATVTLSLPALSFTRLVGGRIDGPGHRELCVLDGDVDLGERILDHLGYMI